MQMAIFRNPATSRGLQFIINATRALESTPTLTVTTYAGNTDVPVETVDDTRHVWRGSYIAQESLFLEVEATSTVNGEPVSTRRRTSVTLYKTAQGGTMTLGGGARMVMPPHTLEADAVLLGTPEISAALPQEAHSASIASERWKIDGPESGWTGSAELVLPYDSHVVLPGHELGLSVWRQNSDGWQRLESYVDADSRTVHAKVDGPGSFEVLYQTASEVSHLLPETTALLANYPNPFNPSTTIPFELRGASQIELSIFNVLGQKVATVAKGWYAAGQHNVLWDGHDFSGRMVASGVYIYRMQTRPADGSGSITQARKLVLMR